jgi:hypothetical protein
MLWQAVAELEALRRPREQSAEQVASGGAGAGQRADPVELTEWIDGLRAAAQKAITFHGPGATSSGLAVLAGVPRGTRGRASSGQM